MSDHRSRNFVVAISLLLILVCAYIDAIASPATDWLESVQNSDGSYGIQTDVSTLTQSTAEVLVTYRVLGETSRPGIAAAINYINSDTYLNTENLSRLIVVNSQYGNSVTGYLTQLEAQQNIDGGFGDLPGYHSTSIDTAYALYAFATATQGAPGVIDGAISYLLDQQSNDGSFSLSDHNESSIYITSMCVTSLRHYLFQYQMSNQLNLALDYIINAQAETGGWENQWESALALNSIVPLITDKTRYAASVQRLRSEQLANGSWNNDAYITALAERAIYFADTITDPVNPANGSISGHVISQATGEPIAGASIALEQDPFTTVLSAADGSFSITNVPANSYILQYSAVGFGGASQMLAVQAGSLLDMGSVSLAPLTNVGIVRGTVTVNTDGSVIAGAQVSISGAFTASVMTDATGSYEVAGATGNVIIAIAAPGYDTAVASGQLKASSTLIFSPSLFDQGTTTSDPNVRLSGVIVDGENGQPVQGANITVSPSGGSAVSDSQGAFSLADLQSGEILVSVMHGDYLQQQLSLVASNGAVINLGVVRLYKQAPTASSIAGVVTDSASGNPVSGAAVRLVGTSDVTTTNLAGEYQFSNLSGTQFSVTVNAAGYFASTNNISIAQPTNIDLNFSLTRSSSADFDITDMHTVSGVYQYGAGVKFDIDAVLQNTGATDRNVRVFYKVVNTVGQTVEEGPTVPVPLNGDPSLAILSVPAGGATTTTIKWHTGAFAPDDYQVIAQVYDATTGQLLAERGIGITVMATNRIGGSAEFDPPIAQLVSNTPVKVSAKIMNTGNQPIAATSVSASLKLVKEGYKSRRDVVSVENTLTDPGFNQTQGVDIDSNGNVYVANKQGGTVSIISPTDAVTVFASNITSPVDVDVDATGNVYILQQDSSFVVIKADGARVEVTTGMQGQSGIEAQANGDAYITSGNALYNVTLTGVVTKIISGGIANPHDMVVAADGTVYVASGDDSSISQYKNGELSTFVKGINQPYGLAIDTNQDLIVTSYGDNTLLRVTPQGVVSVITSDLSGPYDVTLDPAGNYVVSNTISNEITQVDRAGNKTALSEATTNGPYAAVYNAAGELFVANAGSSNIVKFDQSGDATEFANGISDPRMLILASDGGFDVLQSNGSIQHVAPDGSHTKIVDGHSTVTDFVKAPDGNGYIVVERSTRTLVRADSAGQYSTYLDSIPGTPSAMVRSQSGNIYAISGNGRTSTVYKISPDYSVKIIAGNFNSSIGIDVDAYENIYIADSSTKKISKIDSTGNVTVLATATFSPGVLTVTQQGKILVAEWNGTVIYELSTDGVLTPYLQTNNTINYGMTEGSAGNIWTSSSDGTVSRISTAGAIDTFSGLSQPGSITSDGTGGVYVGSYGGIKHIDASGTITATISHADLSRMSVRAFTIDANGNFVIPGGPYASWYLLDSNSTLVNRYATIVNPNGIMDNGNGVLYATNSNNGIVRLRGEGKMPELVAPGYFSSIARESATTAIVALGGAPQKLNLLTGELSSPLPFPAIALGNIVSITANPSGGFVMIDEGQNRLIFYGADDVVSDIQIGIVAPRGIMFDQSGELLVANSKPAGIVSVRADRRAESYIQYQYGFDYLIPEDNGNFYAATYRHSGFLEYNPAIRNASSNEPTLVSTISTPESEGLAIANDGTLYSSIPSEGALVSLSTDGTKTITRLATGLSGASDVEASADGQVFITDRNRNSVVILNQNKTLSLSALDLTGASHLSFTPNGDRIVTYAVNHVALLSDNQPTIDLLLASLIPKLTTFGGVAVNDAGLIYISTAGDNTILKINSFGAQPDVTVGDVVFHSTVSLDALAVDMPSSEIIFGSWKPSISGEYQLEVKTDDGVTLGSLVNNIHVGAEAEGSLTLGNINFNTGNQAISATLNISGIDASKLTKIDSASITLDAAVGITTARAIIADTLGNVYSLDSNRIVKVTPDGVASDFITFSGGVYSGQVLAIDSANTMYLAGSDNMINKITPDGVITPLVSIQPYISTGGIDSLVVDYNDKLYALAQPDKLFEVDTYTGEVTRLQVDGLVYARGLAIDAFGNFYTFNALGTGGPERIVRISRDGVSTEIYAGVSLEHEGRPFAADCSNNLLIAPNAFENGIRFEESYLYELIGETGEFSLVFDGLYDMDVLYYDRFGHRLLIFTDSSNHGRVYSFPVTCGGIDVSAHLVTRNDVDLSSSDPAPASIIDNADGTREYVWTLSDVDSKGQSIQLNLLFKELIEGEQRAAFQDAYLEFTNSFDTANPARVQLDIPAVLASSQMSILPSLNAAQYGPDSNVDISVQIDNGSGDPFNGTLELSVLDSSGSTVEQLPSIAISNIAGQSTETVSSQWSTGNILAGGYTIYLRLVNSAGVEVNTSTIGFNIKTSDSAGAVVNTKVSTDKQQYESWDVVNLSGRVRNITTNVIQLPSSATITVNKPDGTVLQSYVYPIRELYPNSYQDMADIINLVEAEAGQYTISLQLTDGSSGALLASSSANFSVAAASAAQALTGAVSAQPNSVNAGEQVVCTSQLRNISSTAALDISLSESLAATATAQIISEVVSTQTIAAADTLSKVRTIDTAGLAPGEYLCMVSVDASQLAAAGFQVLVASNQPPIANAGTDQTVMLGTVVNLDASASNDPDNDALTYQWTIVSAPAGSTPLLSDATLSNPSLQLDKKGAYTLALIVNDGTIDSAADTVVITVPNTKSTANAGVDQAVFVGQTVTLNGSASTDLDGDALTYQWSIISQPDGSNSALSDPSLASPEIGIDSHGTYVLQLVVSDGTEASTPDSVTLNVGNVKPIAHAGLDRAVQVGKVIELDGSGSTDVDGDALSYHWTILSKPSDSTSNLSSSDNVMTSITIDSHGSYELQLVVNDGIEDSEPDSVVLTVLNVKPVANAGPDQSISINQTAILDGSASLDADGDALSYLWSILSKPTDSTASLVDATLVSPDLTSDKYGMYAIQLIVNDGIDDSQPDVVVLDVVNLRPVADAGANQTVNRGETITLSGAASSDPNGDALLYHWSLISRPQGSLASLQGVDAVSPEFTSDLPGVYVMQLIVNDGLLDSEPDTVTITAVNQKPVCDSAYAQPDSMWPPNHSYTPIAVNGLSDPEGDPLTLIITSVTQDEPVNNAGDGDTSPDALIGGSNVQVRSERSGNGNGRVYQINFTLDDGYDTCAGSVNVSVPHDKKSPAIDDGQNFNSTGQ